MKALAIIGIILGLAAGGASTFAKVEVWPNYQYASSVVNEGGGGGRMGALDAMLLADYVKTLKLMHMLAWGLGGLAIIFGLIAFMKNRVAGRGQLTLPILSMFFGLTGALSSALTAPPWV
ncbi:MAG TPA: hypothetical protein VIU61_24825 [Kofleriaceae bacterium]